MVNPNRIPLVEKVPLEAFWWASVTCQINEPDKIPLAKRGLSSSSSVSQPYARDNKPEKELQAENFLESFPMS